MTAEKLEPAALCRLEGWISACFEGGQIRRRELRLTEAEARYVAETYSAGLRPMGGQWYEITFSGALKDGT